MQTLRPALLLSIATLLSHGTARAELAAVWAVDDGTKVKADALTHPLAAKNGTFDGKTIKLFGARNETVAFQVILVGGATDTGAVSVALPKLGTIENGPSLSDAPDRYYLDRNIEVFAQRYLEVTKRSNGLVWEVGNLSWPEVPKDLTGPVPDPLVPLHLTDGVVAVPAGRNQGTWIDVYIPRETAPGVHKGTVEVRVDGKPCELAACRLPVELTVVRATIPDEAPVKTMLFFSCNDADTCLGRYLEDPHDGDPTGVQGRHFKLFRRHLITGFIGADGEPNDFLRRRLDGSLFSRAAGYSGWGEGKGQDMYSVDTYAATQIGHTKAVTWEAWLGQHAPNADVFAYVWDEPSQGSFDKVNDRAAVVDPLPAFVTVGYSADLAEVDIFCTYAESFDPEQWQAGQQAGKTMWIYNGTRPFSGTFAVDDTAVSPRVNPWIQYKYDIERWFYWEATYYNDYQGERGQLDVFNQPLTFTGMGRVNGDGVLVYPGRDRRFPKSDLGFDHPLPSIRLKNWRRGIQDVAYLKLAKAAGHQQAHDEAMAAMVPKVLDEMTWDRAVSWPDDGEPWLAQRRKLAMLFLDADAPVIGSEPPAPTGGETPRTAPEPGPLAGGGETPGTIELVGGCALSPTPSAPTLPLLLLLLALRLRRPR